MTSAEYKEEVVSILESKNTPYSFVDKYYIKFPMREDDPTNGFQFRDSNGDTQTLTHKVLGFCEAYLYLTKKKFVE